MNNLRITFGNAPIEYLEDGIIDAIFPQEDGTNQVIIKDVDDALIETLCHEELLEFFGIEPEDVIYLEVLD